VVYHDRSAADQHADDGHSEALISEQREGLVHEIWYAAPGVGFVEFSPLDFGDGKGLDPLLTMKRIR
jgi:hypothetical protein